MKTAEQVIEDHIRPYTLNDIEPPIITKALVTALRSAGFAVVPVEPTQKMLDAIWPDMSDAAPLYKAMLKAAQGGTEP